MIIMKFGGTSVGTAGRIAATTDIVAAAGKPALVVVSAMSGITNRLEAVVRGEDSLENIMAAHLKVAEELGIDTNEFAMHAEAILGAASNPGEIKACGEQLSSALIIRHMQARGINAVLLDATSFMKVDAHGEPDTVSIKKLTQQAIREYGPHDVYLTQGFICSMSDGQVTTLSRGGSDYTATLLGEALQASEIQIWTDVDGVYTADPRIIPHARPISHLNYDLATMAASCGAKILHHSCVEPARRGGIPVKVLDSFHPAAAGTTIDASGVDNGYKIVTSMPAGNQECPGIDKVSLIGNGSNVSDADIHDIVGGDCAIHRDHDLVTYVLVPQCKTKETIIALHDNFVIK